MLGVYVLDLYDDEFFVCGCEDYNTAVSMVSTHNLHVASIGSFHYYPVMSGESLEDAEGRIVYRYSQMYGIDMVHSQLPKQKHMEKGTWTKVLFMRKAPSLPKSNSLEKFMFSFSL